MIFKKMILTGVMVVVAAGSSLQLVIALLVVLVNLLLVLKIAPFEDNTDDFLSFLTSGQLLLTLLGGLLLYTDDPSDPSYDSESMGRAMIGINLLAFVALFVSILFLVPCIRRKLNRNDTNENNNDNNNNNSPTKVQPINKAAVQCDMSEDEEEEEDDDAPDPLIDMLMAADEEAEKAGAASNDDVRSWKE